MANKFLEQQIKHHKEIEKLQERIIYFTAISGLIGCACGSFFGYMAGKENAQKISEQKIVLKHQQTQKTIAE
jgi:hypothetical protein